MARKQRSSAAGPPAAAAAAPAAAADPQPPQRSVASQVRERQRAVAEREASRLARPEARTVATLPHADRKKSGVSSTPSGYVAARINEPQEWCGPFTVARKMIAEREEARRLREQDAVPRHPLDDAVQQLNDEKKRKAHPSVSWKVSFKPSAAETTYSKRQKRHDILHKGRAVPTLFDLCCNLLAENFEHVESLGSAIPADVRTELANRLVAMNKFDGGASLSVIAEDGIESLELVDCSAITDDELSARLNGLVQHGLRYLALGQAGRCFGKKAVHVLTRWLGGTTRRAGSDNDTGPKLFALSIGGAYLLRDDDAQALVIATAPTSLEFKACPLLGPKMCESFQTAYHASHQLLELSLEDLSLTEDDFDLLIGAAAEGLKSLRNVSLRHLKNLTDAVVDRFVKVCGPSLEALDLSMNHELSDGILASIRAQDTPRLHALSLSGLKLLTAAGLEAFFTPVNGAVASFRLTTIDLSYCSHEAVTDRLFELMEGKLVKVNVQCSSVLSDNAMEHLVAKSKYTLTDLNVSCCPLVSDQGLGYLIDGCGEQLQRITVWGNAQLTDTLFDGNLRANDPTLEVIGVWMKNTTSSRGTVR
jgi:hypothetical protein